MAKIKHIALSTQDPDATAKFYVDVFGLKQVGRIDNPNTSGYYLTDGEINLAILKFKNDKVAGVERGKDWSGIHHFGFQVDDLDDTSERLAAANAPRRDDINEALGVGGHAESGAKRQRGGQVHRPRRRHGRRIGNRLDRHAELSTRVGAGRLSARSRA